MSKLEDRILSTNDPIILFEKDRILFGKDRIHFVKDSIVYAETVRSGHNCILSRTVYFQGPYTLLFMTVYFTFHDRILYFS